jgi:hypothetical protein
MSMIVAVAGWTGMTAAQISQWTVVATTGPSPRNFASMAFHSTPAATILFGGIQQDQVLSDTWTWNGSSWSNVQVPGPSPRAGAVLACDVFRNRSVLFGGARRQGWADVHLGDTWEWDGHAWHEIGVSGPPARYEHTMCFDLARGRIVLYGGVDAARQFSDTWEYDGGRWEQVPVRGPGPISSHAMAYDERRRVSVVFGGYRNGVGVVSDTWEYDGTSWRQRVAAGPPARYYHAMFFDRGRNAVVVVGGGAGAGNDFNDTWAWDGDAWTQIAQPTAIRFKPAVAHHEPQSAAILFGGIGAGPGATSTFQLKSPCVIRRQPQDQAVEPGNPVMFIVDVPPASGCADPFTYQWQRRNPAVADVNAPGAWIDLTDAGGFFGSRAANLSITNPIPALATGYRCRIAGGCGCLGDTAFVYTNTVNFSVACPADFNADGGIDFGDVEAFFERWENGC